MPTTNPTLGPEPEPEPDLEQAATKRAAATKPQRVLACLLCQQRKVKCDRKFPCAICVRSGAQCVPAGLVPRQRRRRFPERDLLERLRHYEGLLQQHNVEFDPMHHATVAGENTPGLGEDSRGSRSLEDTHLEVPRDKTPIKTEPVDLWHAISRVTLDSQPDQDKSYADDDNDGTPNGFLQDNDHDAVKEAWSTPQSGCGGLGGEAHSLFGPLQTNLNLSAMHPQQIQIFKLWQIYLENVNPLLKVTHTPTMQARIINAASDMASISPSLEALIFSIYCVSVTTLTEYECRTLCGSAKTDLLPGYQFACRQALLNCDAFGSSDDDSLTALVLYLFSIRVQTNTGSMSSMLAVAVRIAQRMGIHNESSYTRCTVLEAEMRRRLWWSLVLFDHRMCEMTDYKITTLIPTWDCQPPLNLNDFELSTGMKTPPKPHDSPTESLFAVVRSELADFVRHSAFHLSFANPTLKTIVRPKYERHSSVPEGDELATIDRIIENRYLALCDPDIPLHFVTLWMTRGTLARNRLLESYSRYSTSPTQQTQEQRDATVSHAIDMLKCDTNLRASPHSKGFLWFINLYVPALAYVHILNGLIKRPTDKTAEEAWNAMSDNYEVRAIQTGTVDRGIFLMFSHAVLQAWAAREALLGVGDKPLEPPRIVSFIRKRAMQLSLNHEQQNQADRLGSAAETEVQASQIHPAIDFSGHGAEGQGFPAPELGNYSDLSGEIVDFDMDQFWNITDRRFMPTQGW